MKYKSIIIYETTAAKVPLICFYTSKVIRLVVVAVLQCKKDVPLCQFFIHHQQCEISTEMYLSMYSRVSDYLKYHP